MIFFQKSTLLAEKIAKMDLSTSKSTPSKPTEQFHNIFSNYKWDNSMICTNIRENKLTPLFQPHDKNQENKTYCPICYYHYPKINLTCCCQKSICTECFAANVNLPPDCKCPFCRKPLKVTPNHGVDTAPDEEQTVQDDDYEQTPDLIDGMPDGYIAIAFQYPEYDKLVNTLYKKNIPQPVVLEIIQLSIQKNACSNFIVNLADDDFSSEEIKTILRES